MEVFERIKDFRKNDLGISQTEFGKCLGVSRSVIANIELNALARPEQKDPLIKLICKTYGLSEMWLRTGRGNKYNKEDIFSRAVQQIDHSDPKARQAILDYWRLSDEDKELFWNFCSRFIKPKEELEYKLDIKAARGVDKGSVVFKDTRSLEEIADNLKELSVTEEDDLF